MTLAELNKIYGHMSILDVLQRLYNYERRCKAAEEYIWELQCPDEGTKLRELWKVWQSTVKAMEGK